MDPRLYTDSELATTMRGLLSDVDGMADDMHDLSRPGNS